MAALLQSSWVVALLGCLLYLGTTIALIRPNQFEGIHTAQEVVKYTPGSDPSWKFRNPEFEQWVDELKREREALSLRTQQLNELQARLESERQEILTVTQTVAQLQTQFDKGVVRFKDQEVENTKRQTKIITGMSPEGAALMLYEMPDDEIVRILFSLKPDNASLILDTMSKMGRYEARRAADLTDRLRRVLPSPPKTPSATSPG